MAIPPIPVLTNDPNLTADHLRQLSDAQFATRKIRRAVSVANFDGWTVGAFGALSLLIGFDSFSGIAVGGGLIAIAFVEISAAKKLKQLDPNSTRTLAINQLVLAALLMTYACWRIYLEHTGQGILATSQQMDPEVARLLKDYEGAGQTIAMAIYGLFIAVAIFCQGGMALYYFSRGKILRQYLAQTPQWILAMQRAAAV